MNNHIISYKNALLAHKLGFKEDCYFAYSEKGNSVDNCWDVLGELSFSIKDMQFSKDNGEDLSVLAPLKSQFCNWLREEYNIFIQLNSKTPEIHHVRVTRFNKKHNTMVNFLTHYSSLDSYNTTIQQALKITLQKLIKNEK